MSRSLIGLFLALFALPVLAGSVRVQGYYRSNGTYVAPYTRSSPNSTRLDNYSTKGNYNPYTGAAGTQNPYPTYSAPRYSAPAPVYQAQYVAPPPAPVKQRYVMYKYTDAAGTVHYTLEPCTGCVVIYVSN
jgi:hypothetical protein